MARIIIIGGIESTFANAEVLDELGEEILMFYTRGKYSPGWEGVDMINSSQYRFYKKVPITEVNGHINHHIDTMRALKPDFIYSLGWQQIFSQDLLDICPIVGFHESLLPRGAGPTPIANAILHEEERTGVTLFLVDAGMDTGDILDQLQNTFNPRTCTATDLYREAMTLEKTILKRMIPKLNNGNYQAAQQDLSQRTIYKKINWDVWPEDKVKRARTYPYA